VCGTCTRASIPNCLAEYWLSNNSNDSGESYFIPAFSFRRCFLQRIIHCRYCGTDNWVAPDVVGKRCNKCSNAIFSPEVEESLNAPHKGTYCTGEFFVTIPRTTADHSGDVPRFICPRCQCRNEFRELDTARIFRCQECNAPVAVTELAQ
jgi:hypothetical protein